MIVECTCGEVQGSIENFPKHTPGRLVCYCNDCQKFLEKINRTDLLDECGGTEIIPVYPKDFKFIKGKDKLKCLRLTPKGLFRWYTSCCNTPFGNMTPGFPWIGLLNVVFKNTNITQELGKVRSRVCGKYATKTPPKGTPTNMNLGSVFAVGPYLLKGFILKKSIPSDFFEEDGKTPIVVPTICENDIK